MIPTQITFLDFSESDFVRQAVQKRVDRLERHFPRVMHCEVLLSLPHRHRHADRLFHTQIRLKLPREEVVVDRNPPQAESHRDIYVSIRDAFEAAERILKDRHNLRMDKRREAREIMEEKKTSA